MKFNVTIDREEDGMWIVECPAIPGWIGQGETAAEALEDPKEAIGLCLEVRADNQTEFSLSSFQSHRRALPNDSWPHQIRAQPQGVV